MFITPRRQNPDWPSIRDLMLEQSMMAKAQVQAAGGEESVTEKEDSLQRKNNPIIIHYKEWEWKGQITIVWRRHPVKHIKKGHAGLQPRKRNKARGTRLYHWRSSWPALSKRCLVCTQHKLMLPDLHSGNSGWLYFSGLQNHCSCWLQPWN